jgi:hypothetical protein
VKVYPSYRLLQNLNQPGISDVPEYGKNIVYDPAQGTGYGRGGAQNLNITGLVWPGLERNTESRIICAGSPEKTDIFRFWPEFVNTSI